MNNEFTKKMFDAYCKNGRMLYSLIMCIQEIERLKKNHKAYLPAQEEVIGLAEEYDRRRRILAKEVGEAFDEVRRKNEFPENYGVMAFNGDFILMSMEHYKDLLWETKQLYSTLEMYLCDMDDKRGTKLYKTVKAIADILERNIYDRQDSMMWFWSTYGGGIQDGKQTEVYKAGTGSSSES